MSEIPDNKKPSKKREERPDSDLGKFLQELEAYAKPEEKLRFALDYVKGLLDDKGGKGLRLFWGIREKCIALFQEPFDSVQRAKLWQEYRDIASQAKRLQDIANEESNFAYDQIVLALDSLERELSSQENMPICDLPSFPASLKDKKPFYEEAQKRILFLSTHATKINALRKEVLQTDMRFKKKSVLFNRLTSLGDLIFPERKKLIKQISDAFIEDINSYTHDKLDPKQSLKGPYFNIKEDIKALQAIAKALSLNTHSFTETHAKLSGGWDTIKKVEKDLDSKKDVYKENYNVLEEKLTKIGQQFAGSKLSLEEMWKEFRSFVKEMKNTELGKKEVSQLKTTLDELRKQIDAKEEEKSQKHAVDEQKRKNKEKEIEKGLAEEISQLVQQAKTLLPEPLLEAIMGLQNKIESLPSEPIEKARLERELVPIKDQAIALWVQELIQASTPETKENTIRQAVEIREKQRADIRDQIEANKRAQSNAGLDIEVSFFYNGLVQEDKSRLKQVEESIANLKKQLA